MSEVTLSYKHDEGDTCTGDIQSDDVLVHIHRLPYRKMLQRLANVGITRNVEKVIIKRLDHPELFPMQLDDVTVGLMKTDMVAFIHSLCHGNDQPIVVDLAKVREAKAKREDAVPYMKGVLVGGHDALAEALGDNVYCRLSERGTIECPLCGRWHLANPFMLRMAPSFSVTCPKEGLGLTFTSRVRWVVIDTAQLLNLPMSRYYLPREWNPTRGWVSKMDLTELYRSSVQERRNT